MNLGLAEIQFSAVLRGLLALFGLFLVDILSDILSRSQFLPQSPLHPNYFYANLVKLRDPYFQKVWVHTPDLPCGFASI